MKNRAFQDKIIAYKKEGVYLAVSLNFDLMSEGETMGEALDRLKDAIEGYLQMCVQDNEKDDEIYRSAPKKYHKLYDLFLGMSNKKRKNDDLKQKLNSRQEVSTQQHYFSMKDFCYA